MKNLTKLVSVVFLIFIMYDCEITNVEPIVDNSIVSFNSELLWAKDWLQNSYPSGISLKSGKKSKIKVTADWGKAKKTKNKNVDVIELPLVSGVMFGFTTEEAEDLMHSTGNLNYVRSETRLLIQKYKKNGVITAHFMTIIGSPDYMEIVDFNVKGNTYLKKDKDFSGYILFHELDGRFNAGWKYETGKVSHILSAPQENEFGVHLKYAPLGCEDIFVYENTISYHLEFGIEVVDQVTTQYIGSYRVCEYGGSDGSSSNTGGSGAGGTTNVDVAKNCNCIVCSICGGCLDLPQLKNISIPIDGESETTISFECPVCSCPKVIIDPSFENSVANCVKIKLDNGNLINVLIGNFDLDASNLDLTLKVENLIGQNGVCRIGVTNGIEIIIDTDRLNESSLEVARTILHESFHAYIFGKLYQSELHTGLCPEPNFINDFKAYSEKYGTGPDNQTQHNYMADNYVSYMKEGLRNYFNQEDYKDNFISYVGESDYWYGIDYMLECLSWGGLKGTDAWKSYESDIEMKQKYDNTMGNIVQLLPKEDCN